MLFFGPCFGNPVPCDLVVINDAQLCVQYLIPMPQIHQNLSFFTVSGVSIPMNANALGSREFTLDPVALQENGIIASLGFFLFFLKSSGIFRRLQLHFIGEWHEQDIAIISHACATQVRVRKAIDQRISIVISRTAVPVQH